MKALKILFADDDLKYSMLLKRFLEAEGYEVTYAGNGRIALEQFPAVKPDLVLLDINMPELNGFEVAEHIRALDRNVLLFFLSDRSDKADRLKGFDLRANDYLAKPFYPEELLARIRSMTRRRQKDREDLTTGTLTLKVGEGELSCTSSVRLSAKETALMKLLMLNEGKTLSTELLLSHVWQDEEEKGPGVVWIYISYLREKLRAIGSHCTIEGEENGSFRLVSQEAANG